jgi:hypothetical protein
LTAWSFTEIHSPVRSTIIIGTNESENAASKAFERTVTVLERLLRLAMFLLFGVFFRCI